MTYKQQPDNRIIQAFQLCRDALVRSIMKMSVKQQDVDDILQETFARALDANKRHKIASPKDYLFVVSRNLVLKKLRKKSQEICSEIDAAILAQDEQVSLDQRLYQQRRLEKFRHALGALPEKHRRAILLRKFYGLSHKEIASKMAISVSSVEKYIAAGLKACKQALTAQGYHPEGNTEHTARQDKPAEVRELSQERKNDAR